MGGFGTVYEAKPLPPRGEIIIRVTERFSARLVSTRQAAGGGCGRFPITAATDW